jgi:hypothetical protein
MAGRYEVAPRGVDRLTSLRATNLIPSIRLWALRLVCRFAEKINITGVR